MQYILAHRELLENMTPERLHTFDLPGHSYNVRRCGYVTPNGTFFDCDTKIINH